MGKGETISFRPTPELAERLEKLAKKADMSPSRLVYNIVDEVSKTLEITGKVGVLQFGLLLRDLADKMNKWAESVKKKKVESL